VGATWRTMVWIARMTPVCPVGPSFDLAFN
jgi:hypothetical protein